MDKAKEILYKHAKSNGCRSDLLRNPFLEQAVLNAINEALRIHDVELWEQFPHPHGLIECECGTVYDVDVERRCPYCGN